MNITTLSRPIRMPRDSWLMFPIMKYVSAGRRGLIRESKVPSHRLLPFASQKREMMNFGRISLCWIPGSRGALKRRGNRVLGGE